MAQIDLLPPNARESAETDDILARHTPRRPSSWIHELCPSEIGDSADKAGQIENNQVIIAVLANQALLGVDLDSTEMKDGLCLFEATILTQYVLAGYTEIFIF